MNKHANEARITNRNTNVLLPSSILAFLIISVTLMVNIVIQHIEIYVIANPSQVISIRGSTGSTEGTMIKIRPEIIMESITRWMGRSFYDV